MCCEKKANENLMRKYHSHLQHYTIAFSLKISQMQLYEIEVDNLRGVQSK